MADLPGIFIANYPNDPEVPNCITGTSADKVVVNYPYPGKYGRVLQAPVEPANKPSDYCSQIRPANMVPTFESDIMASPSNGGKTRPTESTATPAVASTSILMASPSDGGKTRPTVNTTTPAVTSMLMATNMPITDGGDATTPPPHLLSTTPPSMPTFLTSHTRPTSTESATTNLGHDNPAVPTPAIKKPFKNAIACTMHGSLVCLEKGRMFGVCNWGWAVPQEVAAGTECHEGKIVKREGGGDGDGWLVNGVPVRVVREDEDGMVWVPMDE